MSIISRLKRVTVGKLESFLSSVEDPDVVFPQLIREMEEQIRAATDAEAKAMASVKAAERSCDQAREKLVKLANGAESAIAQGDDAMAREAVEAQVRLEAEAERRDEALAAARATCDEAHNARVQLQAQLDDIRSKKDEILTRSRVVRSQERVNRTVLGPVASSGSILDAVARMEASLEEKEATQAVRKDLSTGVGSSSLEHRIDTLTTSQEVDRRLAALKAKSQAGGQ